MKLQILNDGTAFLTTKSPNFPQISGFVFLISWYSPQNWHILMSIAWIFRGGICKEHVKQILQHSVEVHQCERQKYFRVREEKYDFSIIIYIYSKLPLVWNLMMYCEHIVGENSRYTIGTAFVLVYFLRYCSFFIP